MDKEKIQMTANVVLAINGELRYQNKMAGSVRANDVDNGLAGQLLTMEDSLQSCRAMWTRSSGNLLCLDDLRKVVATGVRALERFGCPHRAGEETFHMPLQNVNHSFDTEIGDVGVTVLLAMEHNKDARDKDILMSMMKEAYGEDFNDNTEVTALIYERL